MFTNPFKYWLQIWIHPRQTIRTIISSNHEFAMILLILLGGFSYSLNKAYFNSIGAKMGLFTLIVACLVLGPLSALFFVYIGGFLTKKIGLLFGGKATYIEICSVIAWACVPSVFILLLWPVRFAILGKAAFSVGGFYGSSGIVIPIIDILSSLVLIWTYVILIAGLSEVEKYSIWKAFYLFYSKVWS